MGIRPSFVASLPVQWIQTAGFPTVAEKVKRLLSTQHRTPSACQLARSSSVSRSASLSSSRRRSSCCRCRSSCRPSRRPGRREDRGRHHTTSDTVGERPQQCRAPRGRQRGAIQTDHGQSVKVSHPLVFAGALPVGVNWSASGGVSSPSVVALRRSLLPARTPGVLEAGACSIIYGWLDPHALSRMWWTPVFVAARPCRTASRCQCPSLSPRDEAILSVHGWNPTQSVDRWNPTLFVARGCRCPRRHGCAYSLGRGLTGLPHSVLYHIAYTSPASVVDTTRGTTPPARRSLEVPPHCCTLPCPLFLGWSLSLSGGLSPYLLVSVVVGTAISGRNVIAPTAHYGQ